MSTAVRAASATAAINRSLPREDPFAEYVLPKITGH
jgi:hypothetical protein